MDSAAQGRLIEQTRTTMSDSAASSYDPLDARLGRTSGEPVETTKGKPVRSRPLRKKSAAAQDRPKFAVRISRGLVTHWHDGPLTTWEQANRARQTILDLTGEVGEIEEVKLSVRI